MLLPHIKRVAVITAVTISFQSVYAQCESNGTNLPGVAWNNAVEGSSVWSGLEEFSEHDEESAIAYSVFGGVNTNILMASDFELNIPEDAVICGITVNVEKSSGGFNPDVRDLMVRLVKEGSIVGSNEAKSGGWSGISENYVYGGQVENWEENWTPDDLNNEDFGVAIAVRLRGGFIPLAEIENISVEVAYNALNVLPVSLVEFSASRKQGTEVALTWSTASETNNQSFIVERSVDGIHWHERGLIPGSGNSNTFLSYDYTDVNAIQSTSYYRLKQVDYDGEHSYSDIVTIEPLSLKAQNGFRAYPNPSFGRFHIRSSKGLESVSFFDTRGRLISKLKGQCADYGFRRDVCLKKPGAYLLRARDCAGELLSHKLVVK